MLEEELRNKSLDAVTMVYGVKINDNVNLAQQLKNMYLLGVMEGVDIITTRVMEIEDPEEAVSFLEELQVALNNIRSEMMEQELKRKIIIPDVNYE